MKNIKINLQNVNKVDQGFWTLGALFESSDFNYVKEQIIVSDHTMYTPSPAHPTDRFELTWQNDGILEELTNSLSKITNYVSDVTNINLKFGQVRVWKDLPGFMIPFHEDDQISAAHIQIYISGPSSSIGTTWYTPSGRTTLPFTENSGYITVCAERYPHGMLAPVRDDVRYSLYITFNKI